MKFIRTTTSTSIFYYFLSLLSSGSVCRRAMDSRVVCLAADSSRVSLCSVRVTGREFPLDLPAVGSFRDHSHTPWSSGVFRISQRGLQPTPPLPLPSSPPSLLPSLAPYPLPIPGLPSPSLPSPPLRSRPLKSS